MGDTDSLDPLQLKNCLFTAAKSLEYNYEILNNLNVFPVPDGDTGTNMLSTFEAGVRVLKAANSPAFHQGSTIRDIADRVNPEFMKHSRGNSGFILARFFHGFFETVDGERNLEAEHLATGFAGGLFQVQTSLFSPVEGTMITVIRAMTEQLKTDAPGTGDIGTMPRLLARALEAGRESLKETPRLLPILAKAGVVDSGALGFILLMEGFLRGLTGGQLRKEKEQDYRFPPFSEEGPNIPEENFKFFGYCTEINVERVHDFSMEGCSDFLRKRGNSIALVYEGVFLKLHIHTDVPQEIVAYMKSVGTVEHVKIDNLTEQVGRYTRAGDTEEACVVLSFIPGEGFRNIFSSLGVDHCIHYAAHLPSAGEILEYLDEIPQQNIIVLPNNRNILPAVMPAAEQTSRNVSILHTSTIIEGLTAAYGYSANDGLAENLEGMKDCLGLATGIFIYRSTAESLFDGQVIRQGEFFALTGEKLLASGGALDSVVLEGIRSSGIGGISNISFFYQSRETLEKIEGLAAELAVSYDNPEIEYLHGGQFRETLIISLE